MTVRLAAINNNNKLVLALDVFNWLCTDLYECFWKHIVKINFNLYYLPQNAGFRVWVDVDCMYGSTLQAMAEAVENAAAVLVCVSERYKDSPNCRTG